MKKMFTVTNDAYLATRTLVVLVVTLALGLGFWTVLTPVAKAQPMSATEMIESHLPKGKTMVTATKPEFLSAVCSAVKKSPNNAGQIAKAAIDARKQWTRDTVAAATRCLPSDAKASVCDGIVMIVDAAVAADPDDASGITEMVIRLYPDCRGAIGRGGERVGVGVGEGTFTNPPPDVNPPPGSVGGGAGEVSRCVVCHNPNNPHEILIPCSQVPQFLQNHPGDYAGPCIVTQAQNP